MSYWFSPALADGKSTIIERHGGAPIQLLPWRLPPLKEGYIKNRIVVGGKQVTLHVGEVQDGIANETAGITIAYKHRVIEENGGSCCGEIPHSRISGTMVLDDDEWGLKKNKDGIDGDDARELYAAVYQEIEPLLLRAQRQHIVLENEAFIRELEERVNHDLFHDGEPDTKARRRRSGKKPGTVLPTNTGSPHRQAAEEQPGKTFVGRKQRQSTRKTSGVKLQPGEFPNGDYRPGRCDEAGWVTLNMLHPRVNRFWADRDVDGLLTVVSAILAIDSLVRGGSTRPLPLEEIEGDLEGKCLQFFGHLLWGPARVR